MKGYEYVYLSCLTGTKMEAGLSISRVGLGTWAIGRRPSAKMVKGPDGFDFELFYWIFVLKNVISPSCNLLWNDGENLKRKGDELFGRPRITQPALGPTFISNTHALMSLSDVLLVNSPHATEASLAWKYLVQKSVAFCSVHPDGVGHFISYERNSWNLYSVKAISIGILSGFSNRLSRWHI